MFSTGHRLGEAAGRDDLKRVWVDLNAHRGPVKLIRSVRDSVCKRLAKDNARNTRKVVAADSQDDELGAQF